MPKKVNISDEDFQKLVDLYHKENKTLREIGVITGRGYGWIQSNFTKRGVLMKDVNDYIIEPPEEVQKIIKELYARKVKTGKIARQVGMTRKEITNFLRRQSLQWSRAEYHEPTKETLLAIFEDFLNGMNREDLARKHNLARRRVNRFLRSKCYREILSPEKAKLVEVMFNLKIRQVLKPTKDISTHFLARWKKGAEQRKIPWELTWQDIQDQFDKQDGKCYYTDVQLVTTPIYAEVDNIVNSPWLISLDRKDSSKPYAKDNICLCCVLVNWAKHRLPENIFKESLSIIAHSIINKETEKTTENNHNLTFSCKVSYNLEEK